MFKKFLIAIAGFIIVVFSLGAVKVAQIKEMSSMSHVPPATGVTTITGHIRGVASLLCRPSARWLRSKV